MNEVIDYFQKNVLVFQRDLAIEGDCRLCAMNVLLSYNNWKVSSADILGLGSGLNFELKKIPFNGLSVLYIHGRSYETEKEFCKRFHIDLTLHSDSYAEKEQSTMELIQNLHDGNPIIVNVDRFYLDYLKIPKKHFGYHQVVLLAYDDGEHEFGIFDVMSPELQRISGETLLKAMNSQVNTFSPDGTWFTISKKEQQEFSITREQFLESVKVQWELVLKENGVIDNLNMLSQFLENGYVKAESGENSYIRFLKYQIPILAACFREQEFTGTFYRKLYFDFFKSYYQYFSYPLLQYERIEKMMEEDVKLWQSISGFGEKIDAEIISTAKLFSSRLAEIAVVEQELFQIIKEGFSIPE